MRYYCVLKSLLDLPILIGISRVVILSLHCLIFKMLFSHLMVSFFIIPHSSSFVNPFFRSFSNFLFCGRRFRKAALILYHFQSRLSSFFSKFFQKTFFSDCQSFADQLFYYITSRFFCQPLFRSFFKIFLSVIFTAP